MRIYIAGSSKEVERVKHWQGQARLRGHQITHDWTGDVIANPNDSALTPEHMRRAASEDFAGVYRCSVFWLLAPEVKSEGAFFELGVAYCRAFITGANPDVIVSGPTAGRIFCHLPSIVRFPSDELAFASLL
jgi:hypothetical protein